MNRSGNISLPTDVIILLQESPLRANTFLAVSFVLCGITCILMALLITVIIRRRSHGPKLLILHQLITEAQLTMIHWVFYNLAFLLSQRGYYFSTTFCQYYLLLYMTNLTAGLWGLFVLGLNRLVAIAKPHMYDQWNSNAVNITSIVFSWLIGFLSYLYFFLGGEGGLAPVPPYGLCNFVHPGMYLIIANIVGSYLPLVLTVMMCIPLVCRKRPRVTPHEWDSRAGGVQRKKHRLTAVLLGMTLVHVVCFSSVPVLNSLFPGPYSKDPMTRVWMRQFFCLGYTSTPVTYNMPFW